MRVIKETTLVVFSIIMLVASLITIMLICNFLDMQLLTGIASYILTDSTLSKIVLVISIIFILMALYSIFKDDENSKRSKDSILLENEKGNLLISKTTLEKIVASVVSNFESAKIARTTIILNEEGYLNIDIYLSVSEDVVIKELSHNLQIKIKDAIKKACDLEVNTVNVNIQGILEQKSETQA